MDVGLSAERVTIYAVDVSAVGIAKVPMGNVQVPRAEFVAPNATGSAFHPQGYWETSVE
ncbi:MAG: hypothetical protein ACRDTA_07710 [Pseudonocardiaceae bacterium]